MNEQLITDFKLLKKIVSDDKQYNMSERIYACINTLNDMIEKELPKTLKGNAPLNFPELYFDFKYEFERFKEFILYDGLIGKNIVALGGGFSSGKSSFINSLIDDRLLPAAITPTTSIPTYIIRKDKTSAYGINKFGKYIDLEPEDIKNIAHGFGKINDSDSDISLGHVMENLFVCSEKHPFENIAFLDTPGYSKDNSDTYSDKTDAKIARAQLNMSNYILWFVQADAGTVTSDDISFIKSLHEDIPKLVIVNKADKLEENDLECVMQNVRSVLQKNKINFTNVLAYSRSKKHQFDKKYIMQQLYQWDSEKYDERFTYNFKVLFIRCREFYENRINEADRSIIRLNNAATVINDAKTRDGLQSLTSENKRSRTDIADKLSRLDAFENKFFSEFNCVMNEINVNRPDVTDKDVKREYRKDQINVNNALKKAVSRSTNKYSTLLRRDDD